MKGRSTNKTRRGCGGRQVVFITIRKQPNTGEEGLPFFVYVMVPSIMMRALRRCVVGICWHDHQGPPLVRAADEACWASSSLGWAGAD
jgi:hypothetical protein